MADDLQEQDRTSANKDGASRSGSSKRGGSVSTTLIGVVVWYGLLAIAFGVMATTDGLSTFGSYGLMLVAVALPIAAALTMQSEKESNSSELKEMVRLMRESQREAGLSEAAKRVLHRKEERELLRREIRGDIASGEFDAALILADELAERFGERAEAEAFRQQVRERRVGAMEEEVMHAIGRIDDMILQHRWDDAFSEAQRVRRVYPDSMRTQGLNDRVAQSRERYRQDLERRFLLAAQQESVDEAMTLLKELDQYLTPAEAAPLQEVARGVIGKSRENLGVRFKLLVQDHEYASAIEIGQRIMTEFPNSRMAQEVRDLMPKLRSRSADLGVGAKA